MSTVTSPTAAPARHSVALWLVSFGYWTVEGLLNSGSEIIDVVTGDIDATIWEPAVWELTSSYAFALLTPFLVVFAWRHRFARATWRRTLALYLPAMIAFVLLHVAGMVGMRKVVYAVAGARYVFGDLGLELPYEALKDVATFWILVGLAFGFDYYRRYRDRDVRAAQLESQLAAARLQHLRQQLHPHFLFNTLNTISAVMHEDVRAADAMLSRLSDLLRLATRHAGDQEVRLQEELDALDLYLEIMRVRMGDRLRSAVEVAPDARDALVPFLVLQPLVENAVKHGIAPRPGGGWLAVRAYRRNGALRLEIEDDGPGVADAAGALSAGFGLGGTAERLEHLYGAAARPLLGRGGRGGLRVTIDIPWRLAAPAPA